MHRQNRQNKYEEYEKENGVSSTQGSLSSYDLLAQSCGCTANDLSRCSRIRRLKPSCRLYRDIDLYVKNSSDGISLNVKNIYRINRKGERDPFDEPYRLLLWHGTSPRNVPGIIKEGFRKGSGGFFGGGIYFADRIAKSAGYAGYGGGSLFFILAEVAPGRVYKAHHTHSNYTSAPANFDSVKGMGSQIPTWKDNRFYYGAILPCGKTTNNPRHQQYDMAYNEYILYDPNRIIVRFVVECN